MVAYYYHSFTHPPHYHQKFFFPNQTWSLASVCTHRASDYRLRGRILKLCHAPLNSWFRKPSSSTTGWCGMVGTRLLQPPSPVATTQWKRTAVHLRSYLWQARDKWGFFRHQGTELNSNPIQDSISKLRTISISTHYILLLLVRNSHCKTKDDCLLKAKETFKWLSN